MSSRLQGSLPKIGVRPTIDGRLGGVRESLEAKTLGMARAAADLITANLRHASGEPVECVVPDHTIGGVAEATRCDEAFRRQDVGAVLTVTPCWCYGTETTFLDPRLPQALWGFNGTDRPGAVYLAAALAGLNQKGIPAFGIYGRDVQDLSDDAIPDDVADEILRFARGAVAVATMRGKSYLAVGGTSMGIAGSVVDPDFLARYLGLRSESVDMTEVVGRLRRGIFDPEEYTRAIEWTRANCPEGKEINANPRSRAEKDEDWETSVKMALILRDLMVGNPRLAELGYGEQALGHNAIAGGFQGQRQWTDHFPNGDFPEAILNTSFDWSGVRQPYIVATENDALNGVSMLLGHLLTGTAQLFSDVRTYWSPDAIRRVSGYSGPETEGGLLHLINSGPSALDWTGRSGEAGVRPWWEVTDENARASLAATEWCASDLGYFPAGGWSTDFTTRGGLPCTMFRINLVAGLGPVLQIAEGETVDLPGHVHDALDARTSPTWPTTWFRPRLTGAGAFADVYSVMAHWGANHGAICIGHVGRDLIALAAMLRIPVDLHNVAGPLSRPTAWMRFGSGLDPVGADYRACAAYGPLYG